jgi:hypothetical protein
MARDSRTPARVAWNYTLICGYEVSPGVKCERVIYLTRLAKGDRDRPVKYGRCMLHRPQRWNHREVPVCS